MLPLWLWLWLACASAPPAEEAAVCDAGDVAWVHRAIPLMWGRRPHGSAEVSMWADGAAQLGRAEVIAAMAADPAYVDHWQDVLTDTLRVARSGDRAATTCYSNPLRTTHDGQLAEALGDVAAFDAEVSASAPFNMADVIRSALVADSVVVAWRAHLMAQLYTPVIGANVGPEELEASRRAAFSDAFFASYLHRDLTCLPCHNAAASASPAAPIPGRVETALFGAQEGPPPEAAQQPLMYAGQADGTVSPWGIAPACGQLVPPEDVEDTLLGQEGFFIEPLGSTGSVWQIERALWAGVEDLAAEGYTPDGVTPEAAFAHLVARSIADAAWEEATGSRLTLAHHLPRNAAQRDRLWALADTLAETRFSMRALLQEIATDPYFNAGLPETCGAAGDGLAPVFDPFAETNGPGHRVQRYPARVLIRSAHDALLWPAASRFPAVGDPMQGLQADLGAHVRDAQPGFRGTDFQSLLAYEAAYGSCAPPEREDVGDGCAVTPAVAGCGNCTCEACVCAQDPYCCTVQWDGLCVEMCTEGDCGGCGDQTETGDAVERLLHAAEAQGATAAEVAAALKDRLLAEPTLSGEEAALVEALIEAPLDTPVTDPDAQVRGFRLLCGAWLRSPPALLSLERAQANEPPALSLGVDEDCDRFEALTGLSCPVARP